MKVTLIRYPGISNIPLKKFLYFKFPDNILSQDDKGIHHWFADGEMNTCYKALDYHVENGRADQPALIYDSPVTDTKKTYTYKELLNEVAVCAGMLTDLGANCSNYKVLNVTTPHNIWYRNNLLGAMQINWWASEPVSVGYKFHWQIY